MSRPSKKFASCDNLTTDSCRSFTNFIMFTKNKSSRLENNTAELLLANLKAKTDYSRDQSCNSIDLNPSYLDQFKNEDNLLLDHLRSSNLLKRKKYLLANHLIKNQLYTDQDYVTDVNKTDDDMLNDEFNDDLLLGNYNLDNQIELTSPIVYSVVSLRFIFWFCFLNLNDD